MIRVFYVKRIVGILVKDYRSDVHITVFRKNGLDVGLGVYRFVVPALADRDDQTALIQIAGKEVGFGDRQGRSPVALIVVAVLRGIVVIGDIDTGRHVVNDDHFAVAVHCAGVAGSVCRGK